MIKKYDFTGLKWPLPVLKAKRVLKTLDKGKVVTLAGLKENGIVGRLVPAGTGSIKNKWNKKALEDDQKFLSEQEKVEQAETPANP